MAVPARRRPHAGRRAVPRGQARAARAYLSAATAKEIGATEGAGVTVSSERGSITLPLAIGDMPDRVVFLPSNSPGSHVRRDLAPGSGVVAALAAAEAPVAEVTQ